MTRIKRISRLDAIGLLDAVASANPVTIERSQGFVQPLPQSYLAACQAREAAEREEKEAALAREQRRLAEIAAAQKRTARLQLRARWILAALSMLVVFGLGLGFWQYRTNLATRAQLAAQQAQLEKAQANTVAELSNVERLSGRLRGALRLALRAARLDLLQGRNTVATVILAAAVGHSDWRLNLSGHESIVTSAAFSPDGARIVTASWDETARIWDAATGKEITVLRGHESEVTSAAFSPDGARIVTASWDTTARIWDVHFATMPLDDLFGRVTMPIFCNPKPTASVSPSPTTIRPLTKPSGPW